jgi:hypothetical protein
VVAAAELRDLGTGLQLALGARARSSSGRS